MPAYPLSPLPRHSHIEQEPRPRQAEPAPVRERRIFWIFQAIFNFAAAYQGQVYAQLDEALPLGRRL